LGVILSDAKEGVFHKGNRYQATTDFEMEKEKHKDSQEFYSDNSIIE